MTVFYRSASKFHYVFIEILLKMKKINDSKVRFIKLNQKIV